MPTSSPASYRRSTEMAAEDMISEGSPLQQPSKADSEAALARASRQAWYQHLQNMITPTTAFWAGFATGLAVSLLGAKAATSRNHLNGRRGRSRR